MRKRLQLLIGLSATVILLGGCGTSLYEMTDDEENLVVQYAAYALAKYNTYQKDGMTNAVLTEEVTREEQQSTQDKEEQETPGGTSSSAGAESPQEAGAEEISLEASAGWGEDVTITYDGYKVQQIYREGDYFSLNPDSGNVFVVMRFTIKNAGDKTAELDTVSFDNVYYASVNGGNRVKETLSFGAQSLSSFSGKIKAGEQETAMLLFQIPEETAKDIKTVDLMVQLEDTIYSVAL